MRQYETMFIVNPTLESEQTSELVQKYQTLISEQGGQIDELQEIGKRRLAYEIEGNREGYYVLFKYTAGTDVSKELERVMRIDENVVRYLTVRVGE
ncbi:30S ribosomal protein S6 [Alicyclobacillus hesperidum URH17-3-68]|uniref:Small ribosomal subunit protein bS6 n=1 Tax=Alicyclobacillus hesperidum TaxID=89784 RepID=A0A1H2X4Y7_9BACL|nr:30S ribosomal protein S6 [Alicyclobacillus hesperidum]KRW91147.1 30S ribosomal protein S6 [Alicyclobacillus tengchongensis]EJY56777.1 30S ribosomal protein S6 [Alicyclobacillus hesperidum URH17-3-68]SDW87544.1 SSU ribosomal protein S6P [Alicyclobacillus hesperidum]GLG01867.1 30S ribosomal protein S6 [Alicyclobacillus hesperidum subsp. aegles]GLV14766.1 30S ribosomal protein S6 [Alicyclobacillus hesperidum]